MTIRHASVAEVRELDRITIHETGVPGRCLMEVAGFGAFQVLLAHAPVRPGRDEVAVLAGRGNNAGDAYVVARFLAAAGFRVRVGALADPALLPPGDAADNARLLPAYGLAIELLAPADLARFLRPAQVVVDGLLGTGLRGPVRPPYADAIQRLNEARLPVLALDLPSGLCGDRGDVLGAAVAARWTATFGALKTGLLRNRGPELAGEVVLVPLPFPPTAWDRVRTGRGRARGPS